MNQSAVVELRRYTLRPGQRDTLVELFDDNFVESQEAVGIDLIGQFRELDDPTSSRGSGASGAWRSEPAAWRISTTARRGTPTAGRPTPPWSTRTTCCS
jgi:hypothetical protein